MNKLYLGIVVLALILGGELTALAQKEKSIATDRVTQPEEMTKKFFADPSIKLPTPTNLKPFDQGLCTYEEMMNFLQTEAKSHPGMVNLTSLGKSTGGKEIPMLYFGDGKDPKKLRVWMQGGIHGNEPGGTEGLFMLMHYLLNTPEGALLLKKIDLAILPVANMDGYLAHKRTSADGFDLNRDQSKFSDRMSPVIKRAFIGWNSEASFDFHEYTPIRKEYDQILKGPAAGFYDVLFLPSGNLNVPVGLRKLSVDLFESNAEKALEQSGYTHNFYFTAKPVQEGVVLAKGGNSPRSSSSSYALSNSVSILIEMRGIGLGRTSFVRRTHCTFLVAKSLLETASANAGKVRKTVNDAIRQTIKRTNDIVVTADETLVHYPVKFIDMKSNEVVAPDMKVYDALLSYSTLSRKRPVAYLLLPECKAEVEILKTLGINILVSNKSMTVPVEGFTVTSYKEETVEWEGLFPVTVQTKLAPVTKTFPAGSYIVRLDQKNGNYIGTLIEPESENSFVYSALTKTAMGKELPYYRFEKGKLPY